MIHSCWGASECFHHAGAPQPRSIVIRAHPHTALPLITHSEWLDALALTNCLSSTLHTMRQNSMSGNRWIDAERWARKVDGLSQNLKPLDAIAGVTPVASASEWMMMWISRTVKEGKSIHTVSLRKCSLVLFLKHTHAICSVCRCCVRVGHHLLPIRKTLCFQTCPLTVDREVLNELKLDKTRLRHHGNTNHRSYSWHPPDFPEQCVQLYAPLILPH